MKTLVFNYKRNLQLESFKESFNLHCLEKSNIVVLEKCCAELPKGEWKREFLREFDGHEYIHICVDDVIYTRPFSLDEIADALSKNHDAMVFTLMMGRNTDYCYMHDCKQSIPRFTGKGILKYNWTQAEEDFAYPYQIVSNVYRTKDFRSTIDNNYFDSPNSLEVLLFRFRRALKKQYVMCYETSVGFCSPFNKVQTTCPNNKSMGYTAEYFEELYKDGKRIDVESYSGIKTNSIHQVTDLNLKGG